MNIRPNKTENTWWDVDDFSVAYSIFKPDNGRDKEHGHFLGSVRNFNFTELDWPGKTQVRIFGLVVLVNDIITWALVY